MTSEYYTAAQAEADVKDARDLNGDYLKKETITVLATIESLALQGINTKQFEGLHVIIISRLICLGFKCSKYAGSGRDPSYHEISW